MPNKDLRDAKAEAGANFDQRRHTCRVSVLSAFACAVAALALSCCLVLPAFYVGDFYLTDQLQATTCTVTSHDILMRRIAGDGSPTRYMPGLGVNFTILDDSSGRPLLRTGHAMAAATPGNLWMYMRERDLFYIRHPVGITMECYYSRDNWDYVTASNHVDSMSSAVWPAGVFGLVSAIITGLLVHYARCKCAILRAAKDGKIVDAGGNNVKTHMDDSSRSSSTNSTFANDSNLATGNGGLSVLTRLQVRLCSLDVFWRSTKLCVTSVRVDRPPNADLRCGSMSLVCSWLPAWPLRSCFYIVCQGALGSAILFAHMTSTQCSVTSYQLLHWDATSGGQSKSVKPALSVAFYVWPTAQGPPVAWHSLARMHIVDISAWTSRAEMAVFCGRQPINTTTRCYYSLQDPDFVSVSDSRKGLASIYWVSAMFVLGVFLSVIQLGYIVWLVCAAHVLQCKA